MQQSMRLLLLFATLLVLHRASADEHEHVYTDGEEVVLWMNTVGPYSNRQETYSYFSLPFCRGYKTTIEHYHETMAEALLGVELEYSGLDIRFKVNQPKTEYCKQKLGDSDANSLAFAISHNYWYQMYVDDLPIWALVGETETSVNLIYTHKKFEIYYNANQIIEASVVAEEKREVKPGHQLAFTYEVVWKETKTPFDKRFDKYLDPTFFQHRIHWFSIFNSFMMVLFLVGLVWMILLRTLNKDYQRYHGKDSVDVEADDVDLTDDYGWKQVHGDVFRPPSYPLLFCSLIGTGYHLLTVLFITIGLAIAAEFYTERGSLLSAIIFIYAICTPVNGYFGAGMYSRVGGRNWIKQMVVGAIIFPACVSSVALGVNAIAIFYHASRAIPFTTMLAIVTIELFVILPLNFLGTIVGRNLKGQADIPCRINVVPRPIPDKKWYLEPHVLAAAAGFLPFGSIFIEMYFIFTSFWAYKIYYVYGFMLLVCLILIVTACVTIVSTYFLLNAEDYRWRWSSFAAGASVAIYVYAYAIYYFTFKTRMYGLFQTSFYFGYMAVAAVGLGLLCGTVGYLSSASFVHKIYSRIKLD